MTIMLDPNSVRTTMLRRFELAATIIWRQSPRRRRPYRAPAELLRTVSYLGRCNFEHALVLSRKMNGMVHKCELAFVTSARFIYAEWLSHSAISIGPR